MQNFAKRIGSCVLRGQRLRDPAFDNLYRQLFRMAQRDTAYEAMLHRTGCWRVAWVHRPVRGPRQFFKMAQRDTAYEAMLHRMEVLRVAWVQRPTEPLSD